MSLKHFKNKNSLRFTLLGILFIAAVFLLENMGLLEGFDHYCYDLAFRIRGERNHDDRIVIASIDEKTLSRLGRWPIRRSVYADLLGILDQAAAVGIDVILPEPSEEDASLARAITRHQRVVLPVYIDRRFNISYPEQSFLSAAMGHVHQEQGVDGLVKEVFHTISLDSQSIPSFSSALYAVCKSQKSPRLQEREHESKKHAHGGIFQSDHMWINFYGPPGSFPYFSVADILDGQWSPSYFADKIVLVGITSVGLNAGVLVPYSHNRGRMPGVEVHANILNNLLDKSDIRPVDPTVLWCLVVAFFVFCFLLFIHFDSVKGMPIAFLTILTISLATYFAFENWNRWLTPMPLFISMGFSFLLAYFFNLEKMKKLLIQAKEDWEESFNTIDDAICIHDRNGEIVLANKAAKETYGPPLMEFLKQRCRTNGLKKNDLSKDDKQKLKDKKTTEELFHPEMDRYLEIKTLPRFDENTLYKGVVQVVRDISEKKKSQKDHRNLQRRLIQAQKMEAMGVLAGGIAHDFNNILAAVMGYTELALLSLPEKNPLANQLKNILKASLRARDLVEQILTFSRQTSKDYQPQPVEIGLIIKEALKLIKSTFPSTIQLRPNIRSNGKALIDPSQMHQIIMNLCTNAKHAMQEKGGVLTVELHDIDIQPPAKLLEHDPSMNPGPYFRLAVKDTGHGMSPDVASRIFEPYFTTKEKGVGTGLGLAMVHGITKNCGGTVYLKSTIGKGTAFYVFIPRTDSPQSSKESQETSALPPPATGTERILFVDDEADIVVLGQEMLKRLGYQVVTKNNGKEALNEFRRAPNLFDAVITDMTMPEMTGEKLARNLLQIRPDIPVILCTGFSEQINERKAKDMGIKTFLMKPLTLHRLAGALRSAIESP